METEILEGGARAQLERKQHQSELRRPPRELKLQQL